MSLRLRIWLACLAGPLVSALGLWWVIGTQVGPAAPDPARTVLSLLAAAGGGIAVGLLFALWLDRHVLAHLRGISRVLRGGDLHELRGLPSSAGWGELSDLTSDVQARVTRDRQLERAAAEAASAREQLAQARERIERWMRTERWEPLALRTGPAVELGETLDRAFGRDAEVREQNHEAARQIQGALAEARGDARESVEQAERGFVEATSLLTTVRELQRLSAELQGALVAPTTGEGAPGAPPERAMAAAAIEELVAASIGSVEHLAAGLARVRDIADLVHLISNRATLVALHAATTTGRGDEPSADAIAELKQLTRDVRTATDHTDALSREVEREVTEANQRMRGVRERVAARLESLPPAGAPAPAMPSVARGGDDAQRLLERVREMVQDATRKGERLSSAGERASRAAERLARRLDEQTLEMEGLVARLSRAGGALPDEPAVLDEPGGVPGLRLLETEPEERAGDDRERGEERS